MSQRHRRLRKKPVQRPITTTLVENQSRASEPVLYLRQLPAGPMYRLADYIDPRDRIQWIGLGRGEYCDIVLDDEHVSVDHCLLRLTEKGITIEDDGSKNLTFVNGVPIRGGARLLPGMVLTLGRTTLLACGERGVTQEPHITAPDVDSYLKIAVKLNGSISKAAKALHIATTTLAGWLRNGRFKRHRLVQ